MLSGWGVVGLAEVRHTEVESGREMGVNLVWEPGCKCGGIGEGMKIKLPKSAGLGSRDVVGPARWGHMYNIHF